MSMGSDFDTFVAEGFLRLPEWVREKMHNVALLIEDTPSNMVRMREGLAPHETLLGYYQGIPLSERGSEYGVGIVLPDTITLYETPIRIAALENEVPIGQVVAETIAHEVAHHFGMDEDEVEAWEAKQEAL